MQLRERALERAGVPVDCGLWAVVGCGGLWWAVVGCCGLLPVVARGETPANAKRARHGHARIHGAVGSQIQLRKLLDIPEQEDHQPAASCFSLSRSSFACCPAGLPCISLSSRALSSYFTGSHPSDLALFFHSDLRLQLLFYS